jgi:hypothetical protein
MIRYVLESQYCLHAYTCVFESLNLIECPEFRSLLMYMRSDLREVTILRRTKLRELVVQVWRDYFQTLRRELAVSRLQLSWFSLFSYFLGCNGPNFFYGGHVV